MYLACLCIAEVFGGSNNTKKVDLAAHIEHAIKLMNKVGANRDLFELAGIGKVAPTIDK